MAASKSASIPTVAIGADGLMSSRASPSASRSSFVHCRAMTGPPLSVRVTRGGRVAIAVERPRGRLQVAGARRRVRQRRRRGALFGDDREMARRAKDAPLAGRAAADPLCRQPVQGAGSVEGEGKGGGVGAVALRQAFQSTRDVDQRVVRFDASADVRRSPAPARAA